jgi:hypothetical protein
MSIVFDLVLRFSNRSALFSAVCAHLFHHEQGCVTRTRIIVNSISVFSIRHARNKHIFFEPGSSCGLRKYLLRCGSSCTSFRCAICNKLHRRQVSVARFHPHYVFRFHEKSILTYMHVLTRALVSTHTHTDTQTHTHTYKYTHR